MKSPFPGMDPYIEACGLWGDFHYHFIDKISDTISAVLPKKYVARCARRSYIVLVEKGEQVERPFEPDVKVIGPRGNSKARSKGDGAIATAVVRDGKPVALRAFIDEEFREQFINIYELEPERRLVTSIEVLSPSNKKKGSPGWKKYLRKRQALLLGKANLVEIDLLRGGERLPMLDPWPPSPYYLLIGRAERAPLCEVWPAFFDRPLPPLPVPLSKPDPDLTLDLQPLVEIIYERWRYEQDIDYRRPLEPPLSAAEASWLEGRLSAAVALRPSPAPGKRSRRRG